MIEGTIPGALLCQRNISSANAGVPSGTPASALELPGSQVLVVGGWNWAGWWVCLPGYGGGSDLWDTAYAFLSQLHNGVPETAFSIRLDS